MSLTNSRRVPGSLTRSIMRAGSRAMSGIDANSAMFTRIASPLSAIGFGNGSMLCARRQDAVSTVAATTRISCLVMVRRLDHRLLLFNKHVPPAEMHGEDVVELPGVRRRVGLALRRQAIRRVPGCGEHVAHAVGKALAGICDTPRHRERAQIVERIRDLLVHRALAVLELALDGDRLLRIFVDAENVDAAVLADDRLADLDFSIDLQGARREALRDIERDQVRVFPTGHGRVVIDSRRSGWSGCRSPTSGGTRPTPNSRSLCAAMRAASGFRSL